MEVTRGETERHIPTYDALGDVDEAKMILDTQLLRYMEPGKVRAWWDTPHPEFNGKLPITILRTHPNAVTAYIFTNFK